MLSGTQLVLRRWSLRRLLPKIGDPTVQPGRNTRLRRSPRALPKDQPSAPFFAKPLTCAGSRPTAADLRVDGLPCPDESQDETPNFRTLVVADIRMSSISRDEIFIKTMPSPVWTCGRSPPGIYVGFSTRKAILRRRSPPRSTSTGPISERSSATYTAPASTCPTSSQLSWAPKRICCSTALQNPVGRSLYRSAPVPARSLLETVQWRIG